MDANQAKLDQVGRSPLFRVLAGGVVICLAGYLAIIAISLVSAGTPITASKFIIAFLLGLPFGLLGLLLALAAAWLALRRTGADRVVIWLRRFHQHEPSRFGLSKELTFLGVSRFQVATIQDSKFQYSFLTGTVRTLPWIIFAQLVLVLPAFGAATFVVTRLTGLPRAGEKLGLYPSLGIVGLTLVILATVVLPLALVAIRKRGFVALRRTQAVPSIVRWMNRVQSGIGHFMPGLKIFRCGDDFWMDAVRAMLERCDAAIIDISDLNENMRWELGQCSQQVEDAKLILAYAVPPANYPEEPSEDLVAEVATQIGEDRLQQVNFWPYPEPLDLIGGKPVLDRQVHVHALWLLQIMLDRALDGKDYPVEFDDEDAEEDAVLLVNDN